MESKQNIRHICLTGFMGSGKSTIGKILSELLGMRFVDTDDRIEERSGMSVKQIFAGIGEETFRRMEAEQIRSELDNPAPGVISLGGGALMNRTNLESIGEKALLIYIFSRPEKIYERIRHSTRRPLFRGDDEHPTEEQSLQRIRMLMEKRSPGYEKADIKIDRDTMDAEEVARQLFGMIRTDYPRFLEPKA
jgi:shikimate kinase